MKTKLKNYNYIILRKLNAYFDLLQAQAKFTQIAWQCCKNELNTLKDLS